MARGKIDENPADRPRKGREESQSLGDWQKKIARSGKRGWLEPGKNLVGGRKEGKQALKICG